MPDTFTRDALSIAQSGSSTPTDLAAAQVFATLALIDAVREVAAGLEGLTARIDVRADETRDVLNRLADRVDEVQGNIARLAPL